MTTPRPSQGFWSLLFAPPLPKSSYLKQHSSLHSSGPTSSLKPQTKPPILKPPSLKSPVQAPPPPRSGEEDWPGVGDYVFAKVDDWSRYYGGEIKRVHSEARGGIVYEILFDDGERQKHVRREDIKRPDAPPTPDGGKVRVNRKFGAGDRVSCKIAGWNSWYDGEITRVNPDSTFVVGFDDGDVVSSVRDKEMMPINEVGGGESLAPLRGGRGSADETELAGFVVQHARVEAKCAGWHKFYPGVVQAVAGDRASCSIMFDDGELKENILPGMLRASRNARASNSPAVTNDRFFGEDDGRDVVTDTNGMPLRVGMRVMSNPFSDWNKAYAGVIERKLNNGTFSILFEDGERVAGISPEDISQISTSQNEGPSMEKKRQDRFEAGDLVEARVGEWRKYYPGRIQKENLDGTYMVNFLDSEVVHNVQGKELRRPRRRSDTGKPQFTQQEVKNVERFTVGERIAVKLHLETTWLNWWGGKILQCNEDGTYKVAFDDGEIYSSVWPQEMKHPTPGSALAAPIVKGPRREEFDVGERVEVKTLNWSTWNAGLIEKHNVRDDSYIVQFDNGERLADVSVHEIRKVNRVKKVNDEDD